MASRNAIQGQRLGLILDQVMACCLPVPNPFTCRNYSMITANVTHSNLVEDKARDVTKGKFHFSAQFGKFQLTVPVTGV